MQEFADIHHLAVGDMRIVGVGEGILDEREAAPRAEPEGLPSASTKALSPRRKSEWGPNSRCITHLYYGLVCYEGLVLLCKSHHAEPSIIRPAFFSWGPRPHLGSLDIGSFL